MIGWLRPIVLFPASAVAGLSPAQLEAIWLTAGPHPASRLPGQSAAKRGGDVLVYHPAVWWISRNISQERGFVFYDLTVKVCGIASPRESSGHPGRTAVLDRRPALAANGRALLPRGRRLLGVPRSRIDPVGGSPELVLVAVAALAVASRSSLFAAEASIGARNADRVSHCVNDIVWRRDGGRVVQDARRLVANGQLVEAEAKLREATRRDRRKRAYLDFLQRVRPVLEQMLADKLMKRASSEQAGPKFRQADRIPNLSRNLKRTRPTRQRPKAAMRPSARTMLSCMLNSI